MNHDNLQSTPSANEPQTGGRSSPVPCSASPASEARRSEVGGFPSNRALFLLMVAVFVVSGANLVLRGWWYGEAGKLHRRVNDLNEWAWAAQARLDAYDSRQNPESKPKLQSQSLSTPAKTRTFSTQALAAEASGAQSNLSAHENRPSNQAPPSAPTPARDDQSQQEAHQSQFAPAETPRSSCAISQEPPEAHSAVKTHQ